MIETTISAAEARRVYNWLGARHDAAEAYEGRAKARALALLDLAPGQRVLDVGLGTGRDYARIRAAVAPRGLVCGLDLAEGMLRLSAGRGADALCQADARALPYAGACFDRLFSAYVLDLLPLAALPAVLGEFRRVLRPGARAALVSLTAGVTPTSTLVIGLWQAIYRRAPMLLGGCRPLELRPLAAAAGLAVTRREVIVQLGVPSEVLIVRAA